MITASISCLAPLPYHDHLLSPTESMEKSERTNPLPEESFQKLSHHVVNKESSMHSE